MAATLEKYSGLRYIEAPDSMIAEESVLPEERAALLRINQKVAAGQSLDEIMNFLFETTRNICPCDRIGLAFIEDDQHRVVSHWVRATYEPVLLDKGYTEDLRGSSLEQVIKQGTPRIINDLEAYLHEHPDSRSAKLLVKEGVRASMTCPLTVEGRNVGLLFRNSRMPNVYGDHNIRLHTAVAERLSQAVEKAYRIEQLKAANNAYFEMLGFVSHELKSPLASIVMDAQTLLGNYLGPLEDQQTEALNKVTRKAHYLLSLIGEYLDLARIESGRLELNAQRNVNLLSEVVEPARAIVQEQIEQRNNRLEMETPDGDAAVECDPALMNIVLINLLNNAVKYGNENGLIRLRFERPEDGFVVSVWNEGPGFPQSEYGRLFRKFSRIPTPELMQRKGTGVGLYTSWRIVQLHGGRIRPRSEHGKWAEFTFRIPQPLPAEPSEDMPY